MSDIIEVQPIQVGQVESITLDCKHLLANSEVLTISNQDELDNANSVLKVIKEKIKELDTGRKEITQPLELAKKRVIALYKTPLELLQKAESLIKRGMIAFTEKAEAERRKQQEELRKRIEAKAERAEAKGKVEKAEEIRQQAELTTVVSSVEKPANISFQEIWRAVVIDETKIPREYLCIDQKKLDAVARATKGSITIPGVICKSEKIIKSRKG